MDVTVFGLVAGTHLIEDIQIDVPHGQEVTIPAEKALRSKDLWRAISAKQVFRIRTSPGQHIPPQSGGQTIEHMLRERIDLLEAENRDLKQRLSQQQAESQRALVSQQGASQKALASMQERLDSIIGILSSGVISAPTVSPAFSGGVFDEVPTFIPSTITPDAAEARIETKREETENTSLSGAAGRLRELRKQKQ